MSNFKNRICSVNGCNNKHVGKGLCLKHYNKEHPSTPEYNTWRSMKKRCLCKNRRDYAYYGGRGIKVCDEWLHDFKEFYEYVGKRPSSEYSLDRINTNGNYEPGNVRWATKHEQQANRRINNEVVGVSFYSRCPNKSWTAKLVINKKNVLLKRFKTFKEAVTARKSAEISNNIIYQRSIV